VEVLCGMRLIKIATALLSLSALASPAHAERWRYFPVTGGAVAFDVESIRAEVAVGATALNTVVFYAAPQLSPAGLVSFRAERVTYQCLAAAYRVSNAGVYDLAGKNLAFY